MMGLVFALLSVGVTNGVLVFDSRDVERVIINIGPNMLPALPHREKTQVIAIEPMVGCSLMSRFKDVKELHIVNAAVAANSTLQWMNWYHGQGESSSLSTPTVRATWNMGPRNNRGPRVVNVISMKDVLESIPENVELWYLKTDMQGFDFQALVAGADELKRAHYVLTEVWWDNVQSYGGVNNDFCRHHFPFMRSMGFEVLRAEDGYETDDLEDNPGISQINGLSQDEIKALCDTKRDLPRLKGSMEGDVFWKRSDTTLEPPTWREAQENP